MEALYLYFPFLFLALYIFTNRLLHKLQNLPPCPFPCLPIIGHLYLLKKPFHKSLSKLSNHYGPVLYLRLGCHPVVVVSSPSAAEECFTKNDIIFANRPRFLNGKYFGYNYTSLPWSSYGDHWRNLRRISSLEVLSTHKLKMLSDIRADEIRSLLLKLFHISTNNPDKSTVDMKSSCFDLTFNVMTRMIAGKRYYGENIENLIEAKKFKEITTAINELSPHASVLDFLPLMRWFGLKDVEEKLSEAQERRDRFMQNLIEQHRKADAAGSMKTMIGNLLALHEKDPEYYTDETIRNLMLVLLHAGSDSTASTMEWALAHLLDNPDILKKAQAEIDKQIGHDRLIEEADLPKLPYIRCIINETLRMQPAAPLLMPHRSSKDCTIGGFHVPGGTILLVNAWDIQKNPKFWDEPEKFKPERFDQELDGETKEDFKFIPFGSGRRGCPGNNLAIYLLGLALGSLIQCFNWETLGEEIDMTEDLGIPTYKANPLITKCSPRPHMLNFLLQLR